MLYTNLKSNPAVIYTFEPSAHPDSTKKEGIEESLIFKAQQIEALYDAYLMAETDLEPKLRSEYCDFNNLDGVSDDEEGVFILSPVGSSTFEPDAFAVDIFQSIATINQKITNPWRILKTTYYENLANIEQEEVEILGNELIKCLECDKSNIDLVSEYLATIYCQFISIKPFKMANEQTAICFMNMCLLSWDLPSIILPHPSWINTYKNDIEEIQNQHDSHSLAKHLALQIKDEQFAKYEDGYTAEYVRLRCDLSEILLRIKEQYPYCNIESIMERFNQERSGNPVSNSDEIRVFIQRIRIAEECEELLSRDRQSPVNFDTYNVLLPQYNPAVIYTYKPILPANVSRVVSPGNFVEIMIFSVLQYRTLLDGYEYAGKYILKDIQEAFNSTELDSSRFGTSFCHKLKNLNLRLISSVTRGKFVSRMFPFTNMSSIMQSRLADLMQSYCQCKPTELDKISEYLANIFNLFIKNRPFNLANEQTAICLINTCLVASNFKCILFPRPGYEREYERAVTEMKTNNNLELLIDYIYSNITREINHHYHDFKTARIVSLQCDLTTVIDRIMLLAPNYNVNSIYIKFEKKKPFANAINDDIFTNLEACIDIAADDEIFLMKKNNDMTAFVEAMRELMGLNKCFWSVKDGLNFWMSLPADCTQEKEEELTGVVQTLLIKDNKVATGVTIDTWQNERVIQILNINPDEAAVFGRLVVEIKSSERSDSENEAVSLNSFHSS